ncbi:hypothetical protein F5Y04DRAFT_280854 [Hypomontagnella monticulosa]|nr:hypothetical protein F5Y04DRAFT_280854 [Hypomontagnella monticulosa]
MAILPSTAPSSSPEDVCLLQTSEDLDLDEKDLRPCDTRRTLLMKYSPWTVIIVVLTVSLITNVIQLWLWFQARAIIDKCTSPIGMLLSTHFGELTIWVDDSNLTMLDELWYGMNVDPGVIQLPKDAHLGTTQDYPWDTSKGLYMLNSYHTLHCLQIIYGYVRASPEERPTFFHFIHCLDIIRLDTICQADDTLLTYEAQQRSEMPPKRMCRSWDQLEEYAIQNSACFQRREPSDPLHNTVYEYTNCPASSPYYSLIEELKAGNYTQDAE